MVVANPSGKTTARGRRFSRHATASAWPGHSQQRRGFTLIEVLVVIVIVGVLVGATVLAIGNTGSRELQNAAERAQQRIRLACERALLSGQDIGFSLVDRGLRFGYLLPDRWQALPDSPSEELRERPLGDAIEVVVQRDGVSLADPEDAQRPQFACHASGELTPFELRLARSGVPEQWRLIARLDGKTELLREDPR